MVIVAMKLKDATPWKESYDQPRHYIKKQRYYLANKSPSNQSYGFSTGHVWMRELDHKEGRGAEELMPLNCVAGEDP